MIKYGLTFALCLGLLSSGALMASDINNCEDVIEDKRVSDLASAAPVVNSSSDTSKQIINNTNVGNGDAGLKTQGKVDLEWAAEFRARINALPGKPIDRPSYKQLDRNRYWIKPNGDKVLLE